WCSSIARAARNRNAPWPPCGSNVICWAPSSTRCIITASPSSSESSVVSGELRRPVLVPHARYRWDKLRRQHQIVFPEGMLVLNDPAAAIVQLCDGRSLSELLAALSEQFPAGNFGEDARAFL